MAYSNATSSPRAGAGFVAIPNPPLFHEAQKIEHSGSIASIERRIVDVGTIDASAVDAAPNKKDPR
jgi:hypothetical protein